MNSADPTIKRKTGFSYWRNLSLFGFSLLILASIILCLQLAHTRAMGLVHPQRTNSSETPADYGLSNWEVVSLQTSDGINLVSWYLPAVGEANRAALIGIHGLGSDKGGMLSQAVLFAREGYGVLLLDLRNHGESGGELTTLGYAEVEDVRSALAYLQLRPEIDSDRVGVFGHSMGAIVALRSAARTPELQAVIAESAVTSLVDNISQGVRKLTGLPPFPFAPLVVWFGEREAGVEIDQVRPIDDVLQIHPRPLLFVHGEQDDLVLVENSLRLYEAALEPKELYIIPNAGHGGLYEADPEKFERITLTFLRQHLLRD